MTLKYELASGDNKTIDYIQAIIEARRKELGQTTIEACKAIAINFLTALKTQTRMPKPSEKLSYKLTDMTGTLVIGTYTEGGKRHRCLRHGKNGNRLIDPKHIRWLVKLCRKVKYKVYKIEETSGYEGKNKDKWYYVVCKTKQHAVNYMKKKKKVRITSHRGLAKYVLGKIQGQVGGKFNNQPPKDNSLAHWALDKGKGISTQSGFDSGEAEVVLQTLTGYGMKALKDGQNSVDLAWQNCLNKMIGDIMHRLHVSKGLDAGSTYFIKKDTLIG